MNSRSCFLGKYWNTFLEKEISSRNRSFWNAFLNNIGGNAFARLAIDLRFLERRITAIFF